MIAIRSILCPTDFSHFSSFAMGHAVALARWYGAEVTALSVIPWTPQFVGREGPDVSPIAPPQDRDDLAEALRDFLKPADDAGLETRSALREGVPAREIVAQAREMGADLVVIGTRGREGLERLVLGSVAEKVARTAPCPVLSVSCITEEPPSEGQVPFKRILCPIDFSEPSIGALRFALGLAQESDARLILLHVLEWLEDDTVGHPQLDLPTFAGYLEERARERLRAALPREARDWCEPQELVIRGKAYKRILEVEREHRADLIVMGLQGRGALDLLVAGSTTYHVMRQASCPVLTLRSGG